MQARPHWSSLCSWWDPTCDAHLAVGVFRYGYGRYPLMYADEELCFFEHARQAKAEEDAFRVAYRMLTGNVQPNRSAESKENEGAALVRRNKEARERMKREIDSLADFKQVATVRSEEPQSRQVGGRLGVVARGEKNLPHPLRNSLLLLPELLCHRSRHARVQRTPKQEPPPATRFRCCSSATRTYSRGCRRSKGSCWTGSAPCRWSVHRAG